ncbi:response regulator transcription factor [Arthrobacter gengyunqii]|uniref:Response regulator transcription factor n=1 Tax=Arthrobacter gengyunqii TaxID=2886940 RepID=A0A9X1S4M1_9MICC|nr:response regulator transcription factor [Arthrobacter gengyunqii]MCC3268420.1 response regulator transcription factor [Arthrobacter gengyunqii]UOY95813.1 response regulator transcription factor [Arthrobacter gengyunqii]
MSAASIKVLIADDEPLIRAGLRLILDGAPDISIVGEAGDGETAVVLAAELTPDVVLMDIRMPRLNGIAATERITASPQPPRVIVLTSFDTDDFILSALRAGASGFLLKDTAPADMVSAVRAAAADNLRFSPGVLKRIVAAAATSSAAPAEPAEQHNPLAALSERERVIARAVSRGLTNTEISAELFVSVATVKTHIASAFTKLDVANRVQLAVTVLQSPSPSPIKVGERSGLAKD